MTKEEDLKKIIIDHVNLPSGGDDNIAIEQSKPAEILKTATEADPEWKQFIRQELENMRNREEAEREQPKETASSISLDQSFAQLIENLPFERLLDSTIQFFLKKSKSESRSESKPKPQSNSSKSKPKSKSKPERRAKKHRRT